MIAFLAAILVIGFLLERYSLKNALKGLEYDARLSRRLLEIGEEVQLVSTLRMTRRRIAPFVRLVEEAPPEFRISADPGQPSPAPPSPAPPSPGQPSPGRPSPAAPGLRFVRLTAATWLMPRQQVTLVRRGSFPRRGRFVFAGGQLCEGDFLGLNTRTRPLEGFREAVVMPRRASLKGLEDTLGGYLGDVSVNRFILEDPVLTLGFRAYTGREPMKDISWTATARANRLMVKRYDYTLELSVSVILNVETDAARDEAAALCEACFSLARAVCEALEEKRVKYAFCTNCLAAGMGSAWGRVAEGLGGFHLAGILDGLGRAEPVALRRAAVLLEEAGRRAEAGRAHIIVTPRRTDLDPADLERLRAKTGAYALVIPAEETEEAEEP